MASIYNILQLPKAFTINQVSNATKIASFSVFSVLNLLSDGHFYFGCNLKNPK